MGDKGNMIKAHLDATGEMWKRRERAEMEINKEWIEKVGKEVGGEEGGERRK